MDEHRGSRDGLCLGLNMVVAPLENLLDYARILYFERGIFKINLFIQQTDVLKLPMYYIT